MPDVSTGATTIPLGSNLRIGYRLNGSTSAYTYVSTLPESEDLPFTFTVPTMGEWEIEYTVICNSCSGNVYSSPETAIVTV